MDPQERADKYASDKALLRSSTKAEAMRRLWQMAREALATRANLGVKELTYTSDLVPGIDEVAVVATETQVVLRLEGITWGQGKGESGPPRSCQEFVLDEAWLLGVGPS
jgi:hypothetical protein